MKIERVLVASDLSPSSEAAYRHGIALLQAGGAQAEKPGPVLSVVHADELAALPVIDSEMFAERLDRMQAVRQRLLDAAVDNIQADAPDLSVDIEILEGEPSEAILEAAKKRDADVIVVARHGARGLTRLMLGSTTLKLLRHADRPVLVIDGRRPVEEVPRYRKIISATDFSDDSRRGVEVLASLCERFDAEATLLHILRLPVPIPAIPGESVMISSRDLHHTEGHGEANRLLEECIAQTGSKRISGELAIDYNVAEGLVDRITSDVDLVVLPSHGKGAVKATLLGSTTEAVIRLSDKPVLVLPKGYSA